MITNAGFADVFAVFARTLDPEQPDAARVTAQQDLWHYTMARMVDACNAAAILPFYGPFGDIADDQGCEDQFRNAFLMGCVGAWSLHPKQIAIAKRVFSPPPDEVAWAVRVIDEMGDGTGTIMIDGKMQDDATVKQCKVMVETARLIADRDPEMKQAYGVEPLRVPVGQSPPTRTSFATLTARFAIAREHARYACGWTARTRGRNQRRSRQKLRMAPFRMSAASHCRKCPASRTMKGPTWSGKTTAAMRSNSG